MTVAEDDFLATTIAMTIIDGEIVFSAPHYSLLTNSLPRKKPAEAGFVW